MARGGSVNDLCFECGSPADCNHHVVPKILGGKKTVPLCSKCHGLIHDRNFVKHKRLRDIGIAKAKAAGKYTGRKQGTFKAKPLEALRLRQQGLKIADIAEQLHTSTRTVQRYLAKVDHE